MTLLGTMLVSIPCRGVVIGKLLIMEKHPDWDDGFNPLSGRSYRKEMHLIFHALVVVHRFNPLSGRSYRKAGKLVSARRNEFRFNPLSGRSYRKV